MAGLTPKHIKATEISKIQIAAKPSALTNPLKKGIAKLPILKHEELKIKIALSLLDLFLEINYPNIINKTFVIKPTNNPLNKTKDNSTP